MDETLTKIQEAGWLFPNSIWSCLSEYEKSFAKNEFIEQRSLNYYLTRLESLGFKNQSKVLDAACGMGQWSLALSKLNSHVEGVDINVGRLLVAKSLFEHHGVDNFNFQYSNLENLPYSINSFDAIFCYGAFMFTNMPKTLGEFHRVLKPEGKIYLNANSLGWYLHLLLDPGIKQKNWSIVKSVFKMTARTLLGKKQNIIVTEKWLKKQLELFGFELLKIGTEGSINLNCNHHQPDSAYPEKFYGVPAILEVLAKKV